MKNYLNSMMNLLMRYIKFEDTFMVREGQDGKLLNGGDYTDLNGKTYAGKETFCRSFRLRNGRIRKKIKQYLETLNKFGFRYMYGTISQYLVNKQFTDTVIDWTLLKKGTGNIHKLDTDLLGWIKSRYAGYGSGYSISDPIVGSGRRGRRGRRGRPLGESSLFERVKQKPFLTIQRILNQYSTETPPPQLDPKLVCIQNMERLRRGIENSDPISANAMPPTGDPETDAW